MISPNDLKYRAFLSYSHADTIAARRLHKRLEAFRLLDLAGRSTPQGQVPASLRPVFRDRHDFGAGENLPEATRLALDQSAALVVLCSPAAAKSAYVDAEVVLFRLRHPDRPVVPVIVGTARGVAADDCFPPALLFELDAAGSTTETRTTLLAADMRTSGDGLDLAVSKVVAAVIGVSTDEVYRRAERERRRRAMLRNGLAASFLAVAGASGLFYYKSRQSETALFDTAAACRRYLPASGAAPSGLLDAVQQCMASLEALQRGAATDPRDAETLRLIGEGRQDAAEKLQVEAAADDEAAGRARTKKAAERYRIIATTAGLGDPAKARMYYRRAIALDPDDWLSLLPLGLEEIAEGNILDARGLLERVLPLTGERLEILKPIAKISLGRIAALLGDESAAMSYLHDCGAGTKVPWASTELGRATFRHYRSLCNDALSSILERRGDWEGSVKLQIEDLEYLESGLTKGDAFINYGHNSNINSVRIATAAAARRLALTFIRLERFREAEKYARKSVEWIAAPFTETASDVSVLITKAEAHGALADALAGLTAPNSDSVEPPLPHYLISTKLAKAAIDKLGTHQEADEIYLASSIRALAILFNSNKTEEGLGIASEVIDFATRRSKQAPLKSIVLTGVAQAHVAQFSAGWQSSDMPKMLEAQGAGVRALSILRDLNSTTQVNPHAQTQISNLEHQLAELESRIALVNLYRRVEASVGANNFAMAAQIGEELARSVERYELAKNGRTTSFTADQYLSLSWNRLIARDFEGALDAAQLAVRHSPNSIIHGSNMPHALMFMGRIEEARAAYLAHKGERAGDGRGIWEDELLNDFGEFEKHGLTHPLMEEMRLLFKRP